MSAGNSIGRFETRECAELDQFSKAVGWQAEYHQLGKGNYQAWLEYSLHSGIRATSQFSSRGISISGTPPKGFLALLLPHNIGKQNICQGQTLEENDAVFMYPDSEATFRASRDFGMVTASLSMSHIEEAFRTLIRKDLGEYIKNSAVITLPEAIRRRLVQLSKRIITLSKQETDPHALHLLIEEADDAFVNALSLGLTGRVGSPPGTLARHNRMTYLAKAREYIEAHLRSPIGIITLARETGVSSRTLGYVFREVLNTTPQSYIKSRRLIAARSRLLKADPDESNVTEIANEHGFTHLGYFSQDYKAQFGELPSETLNQYAEQP